MALRSKMLRTSDDKIDCASTKRTTVDKIIGKALLHVYGFTQLLLVLHDVRKDKESGSIVFGSFFFCVWWTRCYNPFHLHYGLSPCLLLGKRQRDVDCLDNNFSLERKFGLSHVTH